MISNVNTISSIAKTGSQSSSIAMKRQGKLPEQLSICYFNVPVVSKDMCNDFESDMDNFDQESEDEQVGNRFQRVFKSNRETLDEDALSVDSPSSESSFTSSSSSSQETSGSSPDTSSAPESNDDDDVYSTISISPPSTPFRQLEDLPEVEIPTRIIVTDVDLPANDFFHKVEMSFATIKTNMAWPAYTTYWQENTAAAQSNRLPAVADASLLQAPQKDSRGLLDSSKAPIYKQREQRDQSVVKVPGIVVTSPKGQATVEKSQSIVSRAFPDKAFTSVPGLALRRTSFTNKFSQVPRPAPTPEASLTAAKSFQTYPLVRQARSPRVCLKRVPEHSVQQQDIVTKVASALFAGSTCAIVDVEECTFDEPCKPISEKPVVKRGVRFFIDETVEPELHTPESAKAIEKPVRGILVRRQPRSILVKPTNASKPGSKRSDRVVSFAAEEHVQVVDRWIQAEPRVASILSHRNSRKSQTIRAARKVSFADDVDVQIVDRWIQAEPNSILVNRDAEQQPAIRPARKVSFAEEDDVHTVDRWIQAEPRPLSILARPNAHKSSSAHATRKVSFAEEVQVQIVDRWIQSEHQLRSILVKPTEDKSKKLFAPRSVSFADEVQVSYFEPDSLAVQFIEQFQATADIDDEASESEWDQSIDSIDEYGEPTLSGDEDDDEQQYWLACASEDSSDGEDNEDYEDEDEISTTYYSDEDSDYEDEEEDDGVDMDEATFVNTMTNSVTEPIVEPVAETPSASRSRHQDVMDLLDLFPVVPSSLPGVPLKKTKSSRSLRASLQL